MTRARGREARRELSVAPEAEARGGKSAARIKREEKQTVRKKKDFHKSLLMQLAAQQAAVDDHKKFVAVRHIQELDSKKGRRLKAKAENKEAKRLQAARAREVEQDIQREAAAREQRQTTEHWDRVDAKREEAAEALAQAEAYEAAVASGAIQGPERKLHVSVPRTESEIQQREQLPIVSEEQPIIEHLDAPRPGVILVCGETGCGKTTQLPQFCWEAGYGDQRSTLHKGKIACTQPRRVAALNMARRVADELHLTFGKQVSYQVRHESNVTKHTRVKFMTEGILMQEIRADFLLRQYSVIILDEVHERSVNTDILIGLLSRVVPLRQALYDEEQRTKKQTNKDDDTQPSPDTLNLMEPPAKKQKKNEDDDDDGDGPPKIQGILPLRVVIMSATLQASDLTGNEKLFLHPPPVINVDARQYPMTVHFARETKPGPEHVRAAFRRVCQLHERLPPGGVLVFLSTQRDIELLCRMLTKHYNKKKVEYPPDLERVRAERKARKAKIKARRRAAGQPEEDEVKEGALPSTVVLNPAGKDDAPEGAETPVVDEFGMEMEDYEMSDEDEAEGEEVVDDFDLVDLGEEGEEEDEDGGAAAPAKKKKKKKKVLPTTITTTSPTTAAPTPPKKPAASPATTPQTTGAVGASTKPEGHVDSLCVLPLYALLNPLLQQRVFGEPGTGQRLCVVSTNVAETSLTIPGIRYVVDSGRVKAKRYDASTGVSTFKVVWTSQSSANQRAGRAGRLGPGHCYRLYTPAVFANRMNVFDPPEILHTPVDSLVLFLKSLGIQNVLSFPFPTPPSDDALKGALHHLQALGAVDARYRCTQLGRRLMRFPVLPRFARMLERATNHGDLTVLRQVIIIVSSVSIMTDVFLHLPELHAPEKDESSEEEEEENPAEEGTEEAVSRNQLKAQRKAEREREREQRKQLQARYQAALAQFASPGSDLITALRVIRAYVEAKDPQGFCRKNFLVHRNLKEVTLLREQLIDLLVDGGVVLAGSGSTPPSMEPFVEDQEDGRTLVEGRRRRPGLSPAAAALFEIGTPMEPAQEIHVRKIVATGLIDQVARRLLPEEASRLKIRCRPDGFAKATPYVDIVSRQTVWVHPSSAVSHTQPAPDFMIYCSLQQSRVARKKKTPEGATAAKGPMKTYMKGVTVVRKEWLRELGVSPSDLRVL